MTRILFYGDVVGRSGREAVHKHFKPIKDEFKPDLIILNGENAASGFGITSKIADEFFALGVDVITTGNHIWDQRDIFNYINVNKKLLRPGNFPKMSPGQGACVIERNGKKMLVMNMMGRLSMDPLDDPFATAEDMLKFYKIGKNIDAIFIDFHAEATSEKAAFALHFDGRVSAVIGTHTHVPTADCRVFPGGTAFQSDAGMCGDYCSVIGMQHKEAIDRFVTKMRRGRLKPALGEGSVCGCIIDLDDDGLATSITGFQRGGLLGK